MRFPHYLLIGAMLLPSCKGCKDNDEPPPMPIATATASQPAPTAELTAEPVAPGSVVQPELDNRDDGLTGGTTLTVSGAKANLQVPTDWKVTKGEVNVASAADGKSRLGVVSYGTGSHTDVLDKTASATGLSACQWQPTQTLTVGKDKLSAQAADGKCKRAGADVNAAYMATEGLLAVGSWDQTADRNNLFSSMRSVAGLKAGGPAASRLVGCCRVLAQNAKLSAVNAALAQFGMKCN